MKLTFDDIKKITCGAVRITEENNGVAFHRFTKEQEDFYKNHNEGFYIKSMATSGIKLAFDTDSENLFLDITPSHGSSREYFSFDIFVNGTVLDYIDNFSGETLPENYTISKLSLSKCSKNVYLGKGAKNVCIYFPWSANIVLSEIALDDGSFVNAVKPAKKLLAFGDSITQGYDALRPSNKYITQLAEYLDAEEYNKAIGGEIFNPTLSLMADDFVPDYITVAYGTNDWRVCTKDDFVKNCGEFYKNLSKMYPNSKIFALTPIWRANCMEDIGFDKFEEVEKIIADSVKDFKNITLIRGFDLVPENKNLFSDFYLHPNDEGFKLYGKNLIDKFSKL